ncbi:hypothetical protein [Planctobacterium marinum]|uniref:hypothetical protein n=1 Tax=Planctobacterium marinum TaxID=1631968 RepID=UPI001E3153F5|nr:hypothetical protein [Planctobacterium marinum]MCC2604543.1 hypothetical protein [Planctobacterium marinum]
MQPSIKESLKSGGEPESQLNLLLDYFRDNPGLMLSVSYLMLTLCGIFYSVTFYNEFGISVLKFADVADLMVVGISEPAALVMFSGGLVVAWAFDLVLIYCYPIRQKWLKAPHSLKRSIILFFNYVPKSRQGLLLGFVVMFMVYAHLFVSLYAQWRSGDIKASKDDYVNVKAEQISASDKLKLLGSTTNYLFVFDVAANQSLIIPVEAVTVILPAPPVPEIKASLEKQTSDTAEK